MSNELIVIEKMELVPFFTKGDQVEDLLSQIEKEVLAFVPDVTSNKGRASIKAMVTKVTKSKTYLESKGKDLAAEYKAIPKVIDANRRIVKDKLTALADQVRKPLTDYEAEQLEAQLQKKRVRDAEELAAKVDQDHEFGLLLNNQFDADAKAEEEAIQKAEAEREAQAKADQEAREKQIAQQAAAMANVDQETAEKRAIEAERLAKQQKAQAELDLKAAEQRRIEAEKQAVINAETAAEQARLAEVARVDAENKRVADEQTKREANKKHIGLIRKEAKESIMALGIYEDAAKKLVLAIHNDEIANVSITY